MGVQTRTSGEGKAPSLSEHHRGSVWSGRSSFVVVLKGNDFRNPWGLKTNLRPVGRLARRQIAVANVWHSALARKLRKSSNRGSQHFLVQRPGELAVLVADDHQGRNIDRIGGIDVSLEQREDLGRGKRGKEQHGDEHECDRQGKGLHAKLLSGLGRIRCHHHGHGDWRNHFAEAAPMPATSGVQERCPGLRSCCSTA